MMKMTKTREEIAEEVLRAIDVELALKLPEGSRWLLIVATSPGAEVRVTSGVPLDARMTTGLLRELADSAEDHGVKLVRGPRST